MTGPIEYLLLDVTVIGNTLAFKLMTSILEVIKDSGAKEEEAIAAINATKAMITELELSQKPTVSIHVGPSHPQA